MLSRIFCSSRPPDTLVASSLKGGRRLGELSAAAQAVAERAQGGGRWILAYKDPFDFAAGLFGLLAARCTVAIPPSHLPGVINGMAGNTRGILEGEAVRGGASNYLEHEIPDGEVEFWTSGSTGTPKRVTRRFSQLAAEVDLLETLFGSQCGAGPVIGTVPHHHIYGCLFRVLWPLRAGRIFITEPCNTADCFAKALSQPEKPVLVSSPAHLSRLPLLVPLEDAPSPPSAVFSSGGPLAQGDACLWRRWVPSGVVEVYGSTESGGIAWRKQDDQPESAAWQAFPDVTLSQDPDCALLIQSPRVEGVMRMEDGVDMLPDGRFRLLGRLDRVVKVEEKRVSLPELETALEAHPAVHKAAAVLLQHHRQFLGVAVVLHREAAIQDRKELIALLRAHLAKRFEAVALPRRWRFVEELPADERGKLQPADLTRLFEGPESSETGIAGNYANYS